jgi:outer membrane protein TolC
MQKQKDLANLQIKSDQAAYYPDMAIFGQLNYSSYTTKFKLDDLSNVNTIGLKATIPIFSSGLRRNKLMQSKLELQELNEDFETNKKQLGTAYQNALNTLMSAWKSLHDQQDNRVLAHDVYKQVKLSFNEGVASLTDLLNVASSLLEAEDLYNQQLLKYRIAGLDLKKSTGELQSIMNVK